MMLGEGLQTRMAGIQDLARMSEQEMGFSTLHMAFGFLEWYEAGHSEEANFAPLILLPVKLFVRVVAGKKVYSVKATSEEASFNVTLAKKLASISDAVLPEFDPPGTSEKPIEDYLAKVTAAIRSLTNWKIRRYMILGHFSFGRLAMYQDLNPDDWDLEENDLVAGILRGAQTLDGAADGVENGIPDDYEIDTPDVERDAPFLVHDADASQHSAIVDVMRRHHLVISGPPGTGKSQTITNIIANALAGSATTTVLFLSEKLAALEVVKRRLDIAKLGEFCLELHAEKSSPSKVIESLKARRDAVLGPVEGNPASPTSWKQSRDFINQYLTELHGKVGDGPSAFDLYWNSISLDRTIRELPADIASAKLPSSILTDADKQQWIFREVETLGSLAQYFEDLHGPLAQSPWKSLSLRSGPGEDMDVVEALGALRAVLDDAAIAASEASAAEVPYYDPGLFSSHC